MQNSRTSTLATDRKPRKAASSERRERLAEELRANLKKRKALARVRRKADAGERSDGKDAG